MDGTRRTPTVVAATETGVPRQLAPDKGPLGSRMFDERQLVYENAETGGGSPRPKSSTLVPQGSSSLLSGNSSFYVGPMDEEIKFLRYQIKSLKADLAKRARQINSDRHCQSDQSDRHYRSDRHCPNDQSDRHRKSDQFDRNGQGDRDEYTLLDETDCGSDCSFEVAETESPEIVANSNNVMPKSLYFETDGGNDVSCTLTRTQNVTLIDRPMVASSQGEVKSHRMNTRNRTTNTDRVTMCQLVNGCWIPVDKESSDHRKLKTVGERSMNSDQKNYASRVQHKQMLLLPNKDVTEISRSERDLELSNECEILSIQGNRSPMSRSTVDRTTRNVASEKRDELIQTKVGPETEYGSLHSLDKNANDGSNKNATEIIKTAEAGAVETGSFVKLGSQFYFLQPVSTKHPSTVPIAAPSSVTNGARYDDVHLDQLLAVEKADREVTTAETAVEMETGKTEASSDVLIRTISKPSESTEERKIPRKYWLKLDKYDGQSSFETFMSKFYNCSQYNGWTEQDQLAHLRASLVQNAAQCLWDVSAQDNQSLDKLISLLKSRFGSEGQAEKFRAELRTRKRQQGESLQSLYQDVKRLLTLAYPGPSNPTTDVVGRDAFLDALNNSALALRIREKDAINLEDALRIALRLEAYDKADKTTRDEPQTPAYRKVRGIETADENAASQAIMFQLQTLRTELQGEMSEVGQRLQKLERLCTMVTQPVANPSLANITDAGGTDPFNGGEPHHATRKEISNKWSANTKSESSQVAARQTGVGNRTYTNSFTSSANNNSKRRLRKCFTCGLTTHLAADCPNNVEESSNGTSTSPVPHVKRIKDGKLLDVNYLTITINGHSEPCLIDTGCQVSLVPTRMVPNGTLQPVPTQLEAANGTPISVIGKVSTGILLNGFCTHAELLVSPDVDEAMIGMDFLSLHECQWNFSSHTLIIDGRKLQLFQRSAKSQCRRVLLTETVTLPPHSQTVLTVNAPFKNLMQTHSEFLLESHQLGSDLTVARTLVPNHCSKVATCILNTSAEPKVLPEGSCLGYLESVEVCSKQPLLSCAVVTQPSVPQSSRQTDHRHEDRIERVRPIISEMTQGLSTELNAEQQVTVQNLLWSYQDILSVDDFDLGYTDLVSHTIDTGVSPPLRETLRRHPQAYLDAIDKQVDQMLQQNVIEPASSPWCSNVVLVRKKDNSLRVAIDYRRLNNVTRKDSYPLPHIDSCLDALNGSSWFSTLDLRAGYWQVRQDPKDADKTAFITRKGCFRFKVLSFGLTGAPSLFQRLMDLILAGLTWCTALVYLDDIVVFSRSFEEQTERLKAVFERLRAANLKVKPNKCRLYQRQITFLGYVVSAKGIETDPEKVRVVQEWPAPANISEVRSFIGLCSYYRKFVKSFAELAAPLHDLTKKNARFRWEAAHQSAFEELKGRLISSPILALPQHEGLFVLDADASDHSLGLVLSQEQEGQERVIAYASRRYSNAERNYCITRKELLAIIYGLKQFRQYLLGRKFLIRTDHAPLQWLYRTPEPIGQQGRWLDLLAEYEFDIQHRPGRVHNNADALSRICRQCGYRRDVESDVDVDTTRCRTIIAAETSPQLVAEPIVESQLCNREGSGTELPNVNISQAQRNDPQLLPVIKAMENGLTQPNEKQLRAEGRETKAYFAQSKLLILQNGILYRRWISSKNETLWLQLIVPRSLRSHFLTLAHSGMTGGHLGFRKTLDQIQRRAYWPQWRDDTLRYCRRCSSCAQYQRGAPQPATKLQEMVVGDIFERVGIDLTGPHPRSRKGNVFILTYIDHFSKWAEAIPLPNKETITVAKALIDNVFTRLGHPLQILSDQGREFDNALMLELCTRLGIDKIRTTSYKPSTNGTIERFHRTLNSMLGRVIEENQKTWCEWLPAVMAAYRSARHESTGYTPNFIVFGRELSAPIDLVFGRPEGPAYESVDEFVEEKLRKMEHAHNLVREHLKTSSARRKTYYDTKVRTRTLTVGSWVWYYSPRRYVGRSPKWQRNYSGPYLITKQLSPALFVIQRSKRAKEITVHADKLKPCLDESRQPWTNVETNQHSEDVTNHANDEKTLETIGSPGSEGPSSAPEKATTSANGLTETSPVSPPSRWCEKHRRKPVTVQSADVNIDSYVPRPKRTIKPPVRYR